MKQTATILVNDPHGLRWRRGDQVTVLENDSLKYAHKVEFKDRRVHYFYDHELELDNDD